MFNFKIISLIFLVAMLVQSNAEAKLYKWVDEKGITHYGEIIPPEYANRDRDSLNKSGLLEKRPEKINPDAVRTKEAAEAQRQIDDKAAIEQKRRDAALLNTYSNEKEIDQARDRSLVLINARIDSSKILLKSSQDTLEEHVKEIESRTKAGKKIPPSLTKDLATSEARVLQWQADLNKNEQDLIAVKTRFEGEKELYRKLKGGAPKK